MALLALPAWPHAVQCRRRVGGSALHSSTRGGRRRSLSAVAAQRPGGELDELMSDPVLRVAVREPLAFVGGLFAGLLKLDLGQDPLKEWVSTTASSAREAGTQLPMVDDAPPAAAPEAAPTDS